MSRGQSSGGSGTASPTFVIVVVFSRRPFVILGGPLPPEGLGAWPLSLGGVADGLAPRDLKCRVVAVVASFD